MFSFYCFATLTASTNNLLKYYLESFIGIFVIGIESRLFLFFCRGPYGYGCRGRCYYRCRKYSGPGHRDGKKKLITQERTIRTMTMQLQL